MLFSNHFKRFLSGQDCCRYLEAFGRPVGPGFQSWQVFLDYQILGICFKSANKVVSGLSKSFQMLAALERF